MLVDDPVKRVDNMTMAWGLEARVPFLDHELVELAAACAGGKAARRRPRHSEGRARRIIPSESSDRKKGYFPVPQLKYIAGPYLDLIRDTLRSQRRVTGHLQRSLSRPPVRAPSDHITPLRGSELWQCRLLEMWLEAQGV